MSFGPPPFLVPEGTLLDVRPKSEAAASPLSNAANIPFEELRERVFELPAAGQPVQVADTGAIAITAADWLREFGRHPQLVAAVGSAIFKPHRLWRPNEFVETGLPRVPSRVLDLGSGVGRDAVYLAGYGAEVVCIDNLPDALERAAMLAHGYLLTGAKPIQGYTMDLRRGLNIGVQDFDLVTMFFFLDHAALRQAVDNLAPGGYVMLETFTETHRSHFGKPQADGSILRPDDLAELLEGLELVHCDEGWHGKRHTIRVLAER